MWALWPLLLIEHLCLSGIWQGLVVKIGHQKPCVMTRVDYVLKVQTPFVTHLGGLVWLLKRKGIFTLTSYNFCILTPILKNDCLHDYGMILEPIQQSEMSVELKMSTIGLRTLGSESFIACNKWIKEKSAGCHSLARVLLKINFWIRWLFIYRCEIFVRDGWLPNRCDVTAIYSISNGSARSIAFSVHTRYNRTHDHRLTQPCAWKRCQDGGP